MYPYRADRSRLWLGTFVRLIALAVAIALVAALAWFVWRFVVSEPLPYRDPEASANRSSPAQLLVS